MAMDIPITQSKEWQELQNDLKETSFFEETENYQYLAILKSTPTENYLYLPYGPVANDAKTMKQAINNIEALAKFQHCIFVRVEPQLESPAKYLPKTAKKSKDLNPKETWILDLSGSEEDLRNRLPSRLVRYYKNREKLGLTIKTSKDPSDIAHLIKLQQALANKKGINTFSKQYLETELKQPFATLYLAEYQNPETKSTEVVAAGLVFDSKETRYNLQGAQSEQGRKLHATGILTIQLILDAKEKQLKEFDFWGIAPENAPNNHPWMGFTAFKKTFKGQERDYAGTYDLVLQPMKYKFYQLMRKINRLLR